jgi:isoleucyl-tRNA synthetase
VCSELCITDSNPGGVVPSEGKLTVALDIEITDELREEGLARDLVNRIQNMRKDMGLAVQDKINLTINHNDPKVESTLKRFSDYICIETQAKTFEIVDKMINGTELVIDDFKLNLKIEA